MASQLVTDDPWDDNHACYICIKNDIVELGKERLPKDPLDVDFGTVADVFSRRFCTFCRLVGRVLPTEREPSEKVSLKIHRGVFNVYQEKRWRGHIYRPIPTPAKRELAVNLLDADLIRGWISDCEFKHTDAENWSTARYQEKIEIILIDVLENKLVQKSSDVRYLTLSYVWGGRAMHEMTEWPTLAKGGSLEEATSNIPQLFQDMMKLTRMLSERYCWIDALCIPQDNPKEKKRQIAQMDIIYQQALATVIVLSAENSQACIPGVQADSRLPVDAMETVFGMRLLAKRPSFLHTMSTSAHWTRGWTYQEQLLSKRCLYLSSHEAMFYCHGTVQGDAPGAANSLDLQRHVKSFNKLSPLFNEDVAQLDTRPDSWFKALPLYAELTFEFSSRRLSDPADALDAFSGILAVMKNRLAGRLLSGLPLDIISDALLWVPAIDTTLERNLRFPSWTWAGWTGKISYFNGPIFPTPLNNSIAVASKQEFDLIDNGKDSEFVSPSESPTMSSSPHFDPTKKYRLGEQYQGIRKFPLSGALLQFWSNSVKVSEFPTIHFSPVESKEGTESSYKSVRLFDKKKNHCGTLFSINNVSDLRKIPPRNIKREYVLLSRSQYPDHISELQQRRVKRNIMREPWLSEYHNSLFDHKLYKPGPWCLMNVMLIETKAFYAERVAICQIHEDAWEQAKKEWKHIMLG